MTQEVVTLKAVLFFESRPTIVLAELVTAWEAEGYTCEPIEPEAKDTFAIGAFRGHTANFLGPVEPVTGDEAPAYYPALVAAKIPYDETFLVNHPQAYRDYRASRWKCELTFRIMKEDNLVTNVNELVITLLGIQQTLPVTAVWLEHLGIFVGRKDLVELTNYQCSTTGEATAFPYPLFFGTIVADGKAWTTGLSIFEHHDIYIDTGEPFAAMRTLFNAGISVVDGNRFAAGQTMETGGMQYVIEHGELFGKPAVRFAAR